MPKNVKGTSSLAGKNVQNSESIGNLTADTIKTNTLVATNGTITTLTNSELQTATSNISTLQSTVSANSTNIATNQGNISTNQGSIATNATAITALENGKQNNLTATEPLDLTSDVLSLGLDSSFFTVSNGELALKVVLDFDQNVFINTNDLTLQNPGGQVTLDLLDNTNDYGFRIFFNNANLNTNFRIRGATGGYLDIMTLTQADIDFHTLPLLNVASINGITSVEINYLNGVTSNIQTQLDSKQATITDSTDLEIDQLDINNKILFQRNNSTDTLTSISRSNNAGKMKFVGNTYAFRDTTDGQNVCVINDSGTLTTVSVQADFFSSITDTELDQLDGITSNVQTQIDSKQATITAGDGLSFTGTTLNAEVTQAEIDAKQATITSSTSLSCADINLNTNPISGVTVMTCNSIELHNSSNNLSFLDFGEGDRRFRQLYNQNNNTFTMSIDDAAGSNPEDKLQITRTEISITLADLNMNSNDIINVNSLNSITSTELGYLDGTTSNIQTQLTGKADAFNLTLPLELDSGGFPLPVIKLNYNTDQFKLTGNNLELNRNIVECKTSNFNLSSSGNWGSTSTSYPYIQGWDTINVLSGTSFLTNSSDGIFSVSATGLYKITLNISAENISVNNRVVIGVYFSLDDADTAFRTVPGEFLLLFVRDDNQGFGTSSSTTIYKTLTDANTLRFKTRLGTGSDNRDYNDQQDDAKLSIYSSLTLERIG